MFELKVQVTDKSKVVSFFKTLSFVSSEYVLLDTDGSLTVKLDGVPLSGYNVEDLMTCGTIDRFLFNGKELPAEDVLRTTTDSTSTEEAPMEKAEKAKPLGASTEGWPAIDLIINNSTDAGSLATQLYKYLGLSAKNAAKFETLVVYYLQHADMNISWANFQKAVPVFNSSCIITFRKKSSEKGYKALELLQHVLTRAAEVMSASNEAAHEEHPQEQTVKVVLDCMPKLSPENGDAEAVRKFEDFLLNCDKTRPLGTLLKNMLEGIPVQPDDETIQYAVEALSSENIEEYVQDDFAYTQGIARATWATIATTVAKTYDSNCTAVVTTTSFFEAIKPYLT